MNKNRIKSVFISTLFILFSSTILFSQNTYNQNSSAIEKRIMDDISVLAADSFMGRESGTEGEIKARDYIVKKYKEIGLAPLFGDTSYIQSFPFKSNASYGDSNWLKMNNKIYVLHEDFYPLAYSSNGYVKANFINVGFGMIEPEKKHDDYKKLKNAKGKIFIIDISLPDKFKNDSMFIKKDVIQRKIKNAIEKGAAGIIFMKSDEATKNPSSYIGMRTLKASIPVIFVNKQVSENLLKMKNETIEISTSIVRKQAKGYNVAAYINNNAPYTVILGAHYDHVGYGMKNALDADSDSQIYNGADDNASGTAAVLELAKYFKNSSFKNNNYIFMNFGAEELGLLGSSFFTKSNVIDFSKVNYMLNFDMIGRYDSSKAGLRLIGTGSSSSWDTIINSLSYMNLKIKKTKAGSGGSDQMSFYLKDIPVLFFFTGIHPDYHRPSDDIEKINANGAAEIIKFAEKMIEISDTLGKIPFVKTTEETQTERTSLNVTLGIMPDHAYEGKGLRVEAVTDNKPAANASIKSGDIITKIGNEDVIDIMTYMKALNNFKKGEKVLVTILRGESIIIKEVQF